MILGQCHGGLFGLGLALAKKIQPSTKLALDVGPGGDRSRSLESEDAGEQLKEAIVESMDQTWRVNNAIADDLTTHFTRGKSLHDTDDYPTW
jgi:hypothetical protein